MDDNVIESEVGDIHVPNTGKRDNPINISLEFTPQNPFTIDIPQTDIETNSIGHPGFPLEEQEVGFTKSFVNEFKELSSAYHLLHRANAPLNQPAPIQTQYFFPEINDKFYRPAPVGWNPKQEIEKLGDTIDSRFITKLLNSKNPDDFNYTLSSINEETTRTSELQNGNTLGRILGGIAGLTVGSIENFIPLAALATKAKVGTGFVSGAFRSLPGIIPAAVVHEAAIEMDKVEGNLPDFLKDVFIDSAFGMVFFGTLGAAKTLLNVSEINHLKKFAREFIDGIGFNFKVDKKGNLVGFEAIDTTGGSLSAEKVTRAQEIADAAFYKGGIYKVPFVGEAISNILSGNIGNLPGVRNVPILRNSFNYLFGSPLIQIKTAKNYPEAGAFADTAFDHFITTEGEMKGIPRAFSFEHKVKQTRAMLTDLKMQTDALRAELNGFGNKPRPLLNIQSAWGAVKQKSMNTLSKEANSSDYYSHEDFMDLVQRAMYSGETSEHEAVNKATALYRKITTDTAKKWLAAYNLPEDYFRNMDTYLSRVFNTRYMNENETGVNGWVPVISNYLREADATIASKMKPIKDLQVEVKRLKSNHEELIKNKSITNEQLEASASALQNKRRDLKIAKETLQNELRSNPQLDYHIEDRFAFSANEAKALKQLLKPKRTLIKQIEEQTKILTELKKNSSLNTLKTSTTKKVNQTQKLVKNKQSLDKKILLEEKKLSELKIKLQDEEHNLYEMAKTGNMDPRFYNPITHEIKDPKNRLKFRKLFISDEERKATAKAYYNSIMQMTPEQVVNDMFNMMTGNPVTNPTLRRTMPIPDEVLYNNNFMTKDLYTKTSNYVNFLSKRTHLKTSFNQVTVNGNFEELAEGILNRYQQRRSIINKRIEELTFAKNDKEATDIEGINKKIAKEKKNLKKEAEGYGEIKQAMKRLFETRMMGINRRSDFDSMSRRTWMSLSAAANLHNLPATQITDLFGWNAYQHGIWPTVRDGIYPLVESLGGILKTKDSQALRNMAPHVNLGLQDMLNNYADRNWHSELQPDINMGKFVSGVEKFAHFSSLTDITPYFDNGIQHVNGSIIQSRFMELLHKHVDGSIKPKETLYLVKYGIDPKEWAKRMVDSYTLSGGFKTKLGGYMSKSWNWQDIEAANLFSDAVFRGIQNTLIWKGMGDSPFFADTILGMFAHTFTGWMYAATNRYLVPSLQHADGMLLVKMLWMLGVGSLVSPIRRLSRGEDLWPDDMTPEQRAYEAWLDSGVTSVGGNVLALANYMSDDTLLGNLKNDKYKNRVKTGIFGISDVISSTATRISDVLGMANSGLNEKDLKTAAHMFPISGAMYGHYIGDKIIEDRGYPRNKKAAKAENE